jgi:hypothetical protein
MNAGINKKRVVGYPNNSGFDFSGIYFGETVCRWTDLRWHRYSGGPKDVGSG